MVTGPGSTHDWSRTNGLSLRRRPLYPTELRGHIQFLRSVPKTFIIIRSLFPFVNREDFFDRVKLFWENSNSS